MLLGGYTNGQPPSGFNPAGYGTSATMACLRHKVKRVVGTKGGTIQSIRMKSGARIDIDNMCEPGTNHQIIRISGTDSEVSTAVSMLQEVMNAAVPEPPNPAAGAMLGNLGGGGLGGPLGAEVKRLIAKDQIGRIVGPAGVKINLIRNQTGAKVEIDNNVQPGTNAQVLTISGTEMGVNTALAMVMDAIQGGGPPGSGFEDAARGSGASPGAPSQAPPPIDPNQVERELVYPCEVVTKVIGTRGVKINDVRQRSGARVDIEKGVRTTTAQPIKLRGTLAQVESAIAMIETLVADDSPAPLAPPGSLPPSTSKVETTVACPQDKVKRVVGAKGACIQGIRAQSQARIDIDNEVEPGTNHQIIRISGNQMQATS